MNPSKIPEGENTPWRHGVNLDKRTCSCGQWQMSGKPCTHVIAFVGSLRLVRLEDYVHDYYSVERFKATYQFEIDPMVDKSQWPVVDPGFVMLPPKLERSAGRPRVRRIKSSGEPGKRGPYQCKRCFGFGHQEKTCREPPAELGDELPPPIPTKTGKRKGGRSTSTSNVAAVHTPKKSKKTAATASTPSGMQSPASSGPTTRSMASSPSTPISPGPVTRRRAAALDISPGGIARRIIIN